jgi:predicted dienelactone hydrolase
VCRNVCFASFSLVLALLLSSVRASGQAAPKDSSLLKIGVANRSFAPPEPYDWRGAQTHALITTVWYPAGAAAVEQPQNAWVFIAGKAAPDVVLASSPTKFPLILLSHGTGGSAMSIAWMGTALAAHGYIVAAVNHPGNNGLEAYTARGFSTWWERARDLSSVIDSMLADSTFGSRIDSKRIGAAGFSLGGYSMIEIAGGVTSPSAYLDFCKSPKADGICKSPPEFPELVEQFGKLSNSDADFQKALSRAGSSFRDPRVRAVFAMAPALGPAFPAASLEKISIPVEIAAGANDQNVPIGSSAQYFAAHIPGAKLTIFPGEVGHYVFLDTCTAQGHESRALLCNDAAGVDRDAIHAKTVELAFRFFAAHLQ